MDGPLAVLQKKTIYRHSANSATLCPPRMRQYVGVGSLLTSVQFIANTHSGCQGYIKKIIEKYYHNYQITKFYMRI